MGSFSRSFGSKIYSGSWVKKASNLKVQKESVLVRKNENWISQATENFATKTHGEASYINASNWGKFGEFYIMFR